MSDENNWDNVFKLIKKAENLIADKDIHINNNELVYNKIDPIPNRFVYNVSLDNKLINLEFKNEVNYFEYKDIFWDEVETLRHYLPTGLAEDNMPTSEFMLERYKFDLNVLDQDTNIEDKLNKNKYMYNSILDDILLNVAKRNKIKKLESYYNLYYNENLINSNLDSFFLNYMKKKRRILLWF